MKSQLNTRVPAKTRKTIEQISNLTGIAVQDIVLDALKALAGEEDEITKMREQMLRDTLKRLGKSLTDASERLKHAA